MRIYIADSFTREPFKGNPAGVCFPEKSLSEEEMLKITQEFGLSETAAESLSIICPNRLYAD